jgi:hypothetical protein
MEFSEERVNIEGKVRLGATVTRNSRDISPAIVLIMGTGKLDRDGNGTGSKMDLYKNMAYMFAEHGYVVVRYDKRGTHGSEGDFNSAGLSDIVDDAVSVVQYAKSLPYVDDSKIIVCGHSEGSMIATLLSRKEDVAGLILLGGAGICLREALDYQQMLLDKEANERKGIVGAIMRRTANSEKTAAKTDALFEKCRDSDKDTIRISGSKVSAKWFREHGSYTGNDFVEMIRSFGKPVLAITGTADLHMDYRRLDALRDIPSVQCFTPEGVNHILRKVDDGNRITGIRKQYARLASRPMDQNTAETIFGWLSAVAPAGE